MNRFVVGTGRCGSTLLSRMLGCHPEVCSIFEFFTGLDRSICFDPEPVTGPDLAELLGRRQPVLNEVLVRGYDVVEVTYPFDAATARYSPADVPWLVSTMLPRLTDDPDTAFDDLLARVRRLPERPRGLQYREIFDWITDRFGRSVWVERSGSSIEYVGELAGLFSDAHFVHIHRDGPEAALSMREHPAFGLAVGLLYAGRVPDTDAEPGDVTGDDADFISALLESRPPAELYGRYWTDQLASGFSALADIDADRYLAVRFEDLVREPLPTLDRIADFFELGSAAAWPAEAALLLGSPPAMRAPALATDEAATLRRTCSVGRRLLGRSP